MIGEKRKASRGKREGRWGERGDMGASANGRRSCTGPDQNTADSEEAGEVVDVYIETIRYKVSEVGEDFFEEKKRAQGGAPFGTLYLRLTARTLLLKLPQGGSQVVTGLSLAESDPYLAGCMSGVRIINSFSLKNLIEENLNLGRRIANKVAYQ